MALYSYEIRLIRETALGSLVDDLAGAGLLSLIDSDTVEWLGFQIGYSQFERPEGVSVTTLAPDSDLFHRFLHSRGNELIDWFWKALAGAKLLYAFIPSGSDAEYYEASVPVSTYQWTQLRELLETGSVRVVHPFMVFSSRLGDGRPCARAARLGWECRQGIGCRGGVPESSDQGFEIIEMGSMYPIFREVWE
jgi:hypothetical protein